ncbi:hypothetical protein BU16DRAFT_101447 [Lophium mytilinum]|uniref:Uncharacterized protein n=1 Tax=Lophium mytilinum TaxID=390894 RepID=A0A6A6QIH4_9PEZI|nr:hypothetical protein BU16DRAFT_101447 [Lophium mytilinum]
MKNPSRLFRVVKTQSNPTVDLTRFRIPKRCRSNVSASKSLIHTSFADGFEGAELNMLPKLPRRIRRRPRPTNGSTLVLVKGLLPAPCFASLKQDHTLVMGITDSTPAERLDEEQPRNETGLEKQNNTTSQGMPACKQVQEQQSSCSVIDEDEIMPEIPDARVMFMEDHTFGDDALGEGEIGGNDADDEGGYQNEDYAEEFEEEVESELDEPLREDGQGFEEETDGAGDDAEDEDESTADEMTEQADEETESGDETVDNAEDTDKFSGDETSKGTETYIDENHVENETLQDQASSSGSTWDGFSEHDAAPREDSILAESGVELAKAMPQNSSQNPEPDDLDDMLCRPGQASRMRSKHQWMEVQDEIQDDEPTDLYGFYQQRKRGSSLPRSHTTPHRQFQDPEESMAALSLDPGGYFANASLQLSVIPETSFPSPHPHQVLHDEPDYSEEQDDVLTELSFPRTKSLAASSSQHSFLSRTSWRRYSTVVVTPSRSLSSLAKVTNTYSGTTSGKPRRTPSLPFVPPFLKEKTFGKHVVADPTSIPSKR